MYDLPSECVGDPGLPDDFHRFQPQLLDRTLSLADYTRDRWFSGSDLHLYYDIRNPKWYKRPDWFLVVGVSPLRDGQARRSYVVWEEKEFPRLALELLADGTEAEDLGRFYKRSLPTKTGEPPAKLVVYEELLQIPHYITYDRLTQQLRYFRLVGVSEAFPQGNRYQEQTLSNSNPLIWFSDLQIGLGIWEGTFEERPDRWLRWCDADGNWLLTDTERERQQRERVEVERDRERAEKERMAAKLRELGIDPDEM